jgi:hypothetical protein
VFDEHWQNFNRVRPHDELVMIGPNVLGDPPRVM